MVVISMLISSNGKVAKGIASRNRIVLFAVMLALGVGSAQAQQASGPKAISVVNEAGYRVPVEDESEFDNHNESFVKDWREAIPKLEYYDTEFGQQIYNEASTPTKLEILRLLSKDTPSIVVFLTAISMGLDIESVLQASIKYEPEKSRDLASSAVNLLPVLTQSSNYLYSSYEIEDLERENEDDPYSVEEVIQKFFEKRLVLRPYPDWFEGQFHFMASASELKRFQSPQKDVRWYRTKSTKPTSKRPIFVSLYEATSSVLIDGEERITEALKNDPNAQLPVVFIFNRLNERGIDEIGYPETIKGMQAAYAEKRLMLTPTPEWHLGEYHIYAGLDEFYDVFSIPNEDDFEPEAWQKLLEEAEDYTVTNTSFLFVILGSPDGDEENAKRLTSDGQQYAIWDDPRTEAEFPYVIPSEGPPLTLENLMGQGLIFNRPDLIAALNTLGVTKVPVVFYYVDSARVKPYTKGPRALIQAAVGISALNLPTDGSGGIICASPPCTEKNQ